MMKTLTEVIYSGVAYICTLTAMTNISATSWFLMYQPDMLEEVGD